MDVIKQSEMYADIPPRSMTEDEMWADFDYQMAQRMTKNLLENGLISDDEFDKITALNRLKFCPFMAEILD